MSSEVELLDVQLKLNQATPDQQRSILRWLVSKVVATQGRGGPQAIEDEGGGTIGVFIPNSFYLKQPPPMTEEEYAELLDAVRNTTPDQLVSFEEMMRRVGLEDAPQSSRR